MQAVPAGQRGAKFVSAVCFILPDVFDPRSFLTRTGVVFDRLEQLSFE